MDNFGMRLRQARKDNKITQRDLAKMLDVSFSSISEWENGHHRPDLNILENICQILNVQASWLLCEDQNPNSNQNSTVLPHLLGEIEQLPEQAKKELDAFVDWLKTKYKKD